MLIVFRSSYIVVPTVSSPFLDHKKSNMYFEVYLPGIYLYTSKYILRSIYLLIVFKPSFLPCGWYPSLAWTTWRPTGKGRVSARRARWSSWCPAGSPAPREPRRSSEQKQNNNQQKNICLKKKNYRQVKNRIPPLWEHPLRTRSWK